MRLTISFVRPPGRLAPWFAGGLLIASLLLMVAALAFVASAVRLRGDHAQLEQRVEQAQRVADGLTAVALPPRHELTALRARVFTLNQLTGTGGMSPQEALRHLEENLPDQVALTGLRYQRRQGELVIVAEAPRSDLLTDTLQKLERDPAFREVRLIRQGERSGERGGVQFELRLRN